MSAVDVRECFIDLLGQALRLRGLALKELGHAGLMSPVAGQNNKSSVDHNEIAAADSTTSKKSSQFSAGILTLLFQKQNLHLITVAMPKFQTQHT
jgi:hypothetical protein